MKNFFFLRVFLCPFSLKQKKMISLGYSFKLSSHIGSSWTFIALRMWIQFIRAALNNSLIVCSNIFRHSIITSRISTKSLRNGRGTKCPCQRMEPSWWHQTWSIVFWCSPSLLRIRGRFPREKWMKMKIQLSAQFVKFMKKLDLIARISSMTKILLKGRRAIISIRDFISWRMFQWTRNSVQGLAMRSKIVLGSWWINFQPTETTTDTWRTTGKFEPTRSTWFIHSFRNWSIGSWTNGWEQRWVIIRRNSSSSRSSKMDNNVMEIKRIKCTRSSLDLRSSTTMWSIRLVTRDRDTSPQMMSWRLSIVQRTVPFTMTTSNCRTIAQLPSPTIVPSWLRAHQHSEPRTVRTSWRTISRMARRWTTKMAKWISRQG